MYVKMAVVLCKLIVAQPTLAPDSDCTKEEAKIEKVIVTSDEDPTVDLMACQIRGQIIASDWKKQQPIYFNGDWRIGRIICAPDRSWFPKGSA